MNDGGTAKISGLTINGETIATVSLAQGASRVSVATIASLTTVSNTDGAFLTAMIAAVNAQTNLTNVTARAGSATTMVKTLVLTADEGKDVEIGDIDGDTGWTAASFNTAVGLATTFYASSGDITTYNGQSSAMAKVAAIDSIKSITEVDALVGAAVVTGTAAIGNVGIDAGDLYINGIDIGAVSVLDNDSSYALTAAINAKSATTGVVASVNTSSQMVLTASDGRNISVVAASDVETALNITSTVTRGSVTLNSNANFIVAGTTDDFGGAATAATYTTSLDDPVSLIDLSTQIGADSALATLDAAVTQVNTVRSQLGAIQSRISLTIVNLTTTAENLSASDSRIKDVDFAEETSVFTRNSILTQAATAILAQANQLPQLALQLLG
jgi:flagellin